jgi:hypothetical protein
MHKEKEGMCRGIAFIKLAYVPRRAVLKAKLLDGDVGQQTKDDYAMP